MELKSCSKKRRRAIRVGFQVWYNKKNQTPRRGLASATGKTYIYLGKYFYQLVNLVLRFLLT